MKCFHAVLCVILALPLDVYCATEPIRRAIDVTSVRYADASSNGVPFEITAQIVYLTNSETTPHSSIFVKDDSGAAVLQNYLAATNETIRIGDIVRASGKIFSLNNGIYAHCRNMTPLSHAPIPPPKKASINQLHSGIFDGCLVSVEGEISDILPDEIDNKFAFVILKNGDSSIYVSTRIGISGPTQLQSHIGDVINITGVCINGINTGMRRHIGRIIQLWDAGSITLIKHNHTDIFDVPELTDERILAPNKMPFLERRRIIGTVMATWHGDQTIIRTDDGNLVRLIGISEHAPKVGRRIVAVGFPETDLYSINLNNVHWREVEGVPLPLDPPTRLTERHLRAKDVPLRHAQAKLHGKSVSVTGIVRGLPAGEGDGRMVLESEGALLHIDFSSCPNALQALSIGSQIEVKGVWIAEIENWRPNSVFPKIKGAFIVVNSAKDIRIISYPSWWTTGRLLGVIGILLTIMTGIIAWNRILKSIAEKRKRELREEIISHIASDLRLSERTSLAVELHDTIAQTLTGVALELRTAGNLLSNDSVDVREHLDAATKTLTSCRKELKNCLFDLRSDTLGQRDMETFIRQAVSPIIGQAKLSIRFTVPRDLICDTSAHAIVRITRELVSNAVQHGKAELIKVAGAIEGNHLRFSVSDNGCGFDIENVPGIDECHFGFQGIRERVAKFHGDISIESIIGKGSRISISLNLSSLPRPL